MTELEKQLLEALNTIQHSMLMAKTLGNDYRREIELSLNVAVDAMAAVKAALPATGKESLQVQLAPNSPAIPDGWQLVPIEPTEQMWDAGRDPIMFRELGHFRHEQEIPAWQRGPDGTVETDKSKGTTAVHVWRAMIAAAPRSGE